MIYRRKHLIIFVLILVVLLYTIDYPQAGAKVIDYRERKATIISIEGTVVVKKPGITDWIIASEGMVLGQDDRIRTGPLSSVEIDLNTESGKSIARLDENTIIVISMLLKEKNTGVEKTVLDVIIGDVLIEAAQLKGESTFKVATPASIVAVRGTVFEVNVSPLKRPR